MFSALNLNESMETKPFSPRVLLVGLHRTPHALACIRRWDDKGYDSGTIWNGIASQSFKFIENSFSVSSYCSHQAPSELAHEMQTIAKEMLQGINITALIRDHFGVRDGYILELSGSPWKLVIEVENFPY